MGYRPRSSPKYIDREGKLRELQQERANYIFLRNEMNPAPGDPVDISFKDAIADVDARIAQIAPPQRLPPVKRKLLTKGHIA